MKYHSVSRERCQEPSVGELLDEPDVRSSVKEIENAVKKKVCMHRAGGSGALIAHDDEGDPGLNRVALIHGATGPFAVAGYRMGKAALKALNLSRGSFDVEVIHHAPRQVQWSCIIDGLQAATGTSVGKLNLSLVNSSPDKVFSVVRNRRTGQEVKLELLPDFVKH